LNHMTLDLMLHSKGRDVRSCETLRRDNRAALGQLAPGVRARAAER
jgi:hypothetical protein